MKDSREHLTGMPHGGYAERCFSEGCSLLNRDHHPWHPQMYVLGTTH